MVFPWFSYGWHHPTGSRRAGRAGGGAGGGAGRAGRAGGLVDVIAGGAWFAASLES